MKKFIAFIIIVGLLGCAGWFFFGNNMMGLNFVKQDKVKIGENVISCINKTTKYNDFDFEITSELGGTQMEKVNFKLKVSGENYTINCKNVYKENEEDENTKTVEVWYEGTDTVGKIFTQSGETKTQETGSIVQAMNKIHSLMTNLYVQQFCFEDEIDITVDSEQISSTGLAFNLKPFIVGFKVEVDDSKGIFLVDVLGNLRQVTIKLDDEGSSTLTINKPGKAVNVDVLTTAQKEAFLVA